MGEFPKPPAVAVANAIPDGVEAGEEDIFPDPFAVAFGEQLRSSPKGVEKQMAALVTSPA